jgi:hypothetical protein
MRSASEALSLGILALCINLALMLVKIGVGVIGNSYALRYAISPRRISSDRGWSLGLSGWNLDWKFVSIELYRFAMREGHEIEDFSAIYDYATTTQQTPPASAKA